MSTAESGELSDQMILSITLVERVQQNLKHFRDRMTRTANSTNWKADVEKMHKVLEAENARSKKVIARYKLAREQEIEALQTEDVEDEDG